MKDTKDLGVKALAILFIIALIAGFIWFRIAYEKWRINYVIDRMKQEQLHKR